MVHYDPETKRLNGIPLTGLEDKLLQVLLSKPLVPTEELRAIFGETDSNTPYVYLYRLRAKFGLTITSRRGVGYELQR